MSDTSKKTWSEELEITANELVDRVKDLIEQGNVRRLIIRKANGEVLIEVPLTVGVAVGGAATIFAPVIAALGALAALVVGKMKVEVVRTDEEEEEQTEPTEEA